MKSNVMERMQLQWEIETFLSHEAGLVEERRFDEWYALTADDIHYTIPAREIRYQRDLDKQFLPVTKGAHMDDNKMSLGFRVAKLMSPKSWSENPPTYSRLLLSNVRVSDGPNADEFNVIANFIYTRTRLFDVYPPVAGRREDVLRRHDNPLGFQIARRTIYLDHINLPGSGITTFI